ncbi:MAG: hypothetical protein WBI40_06540 [Methylococcaceae bacterium]
MGSCDDYTRKWLIAPSENENLEFKEAKNTFEEEKVMGSLLYSFRD